MAYGFTVVGEISVAAYLLAWLLLFRSEPPGETAPEGLS